MELNGAGGASFDGLHPRKLPLEKGGGWSLPPTSISIARNVNSCQVFEFAGLTYNIYVLLQKCTFKLLTNTQGFAVVKTVNH